MVGEVLHTFLENNKVDGWWSTCVRTLNFDKYTIRPRIIEWVETRILAIGSSFGHNRWYIVFPVEDD